MAKYPAEYPADKAVTLKGYHSLSEISSSTTLYGSAIDVFSANNHCTRKEKVRVIINLRLEKLKIALYRSM